VSVVNGVAVQALFDPAQWPASQQMAIVLGALGGD